MGSSPNLVRGTVDLLVLRALLDGKMHGYDIARWIEEHTSGTVEFEDAALYQALHRLQRKSLLTSTWGRSDANRRARFYQLTKEGKRHLQDQTGVFRKYAGAVLAALDG